MAVSAQRAAESIRSNYWGNDLPVDPEKIAEKMGIDLRYVKFDDNSLAGGIVLKKGQRPTIFVNMADHLNRIRFTIAHELGHYYHNKGRQKFEYIERRDNIASMGSDPHEVWANSFAANLLMPKELVEYEFRNCSDTEYLSTRFGVSVEAMGYRLSALNLAEE